MTMTTVTEDIDINIAAECLTQLNSETTSVSYRFGIIGINMEYWRIEYFCNVGTVEAWTTFAIVSGETNLVIEHNVNCTACAVTIEVSHIYDFVNDALAGNSRITVNEDRDNFFLIIFVELFELSSNTTKNYGVNRF